MIEISTPAAASRPGLASDRLTQFDLRPGGEQRSDQHRNVLGGQQVRDQVGLGAVIDDQPVAEFVGDPDRGGDVVRPMAVLTPRNGPGQHFAERLGRQITGRWRLALLGELQPGQVVLRLDEGLADHRRGAEPGRRHLLLVPVHPFRVLAERRFQSGRRAQDHLVHGAAVGVDGHRQAADRVARPGIDVHRGDPAGQRIGETQVVRIDRVQCPHAGRHRVGQLVGVLTRPPLGLLVQTEVGVRVDEPGQQPTAVGVDDGGAGRDGEVCTQRSDPAVPDPHGPLERDPLDRDHMGIDEGELGHGTDSASSSPARLGPPHGR